jgi:hypothetical protein
MPLDPVVRVAETRRYDAGLGGSSDFLSCRCENVRVAASVTTLD